MSDQVTKRCGPFPEQARSVSCIDPVCFGHFAGVAITAIARTVTAAAVAAGRGNLLNLRGLVERKVGVGRCFGLISSCAADYTFISYN